MGLLTEGKPLAWEQSKPFIKRVKADGIEQFLSVYHSAKHFKDHDLKWGDEVEYHLLRIDPHAERATLSLSAPRLLKILQQEEHAQPEGSSVPVLWRPEYSRWMIEGTPGVPYRSYAADLVNVERNMALRRTEVAKLLQPGETILTLTSFPRAGCGIYTTPPTVPFGPVARSFFTSDQVINPHPRFPTLTNNIRTRRGRKVHIEVPLFMDENTSPHAPLIPQDPEHLSLLKEASDKLVAEGKRAGDPEFDLLIQGLEAVSDESIVMDSAAFGMGSSCLQVTIQGRDLCETRHLYDQLAVMAPIMLALTAATPALRGLLADTDVRWDVISASMDDRTLEESETGKVPKSRYSSIDCFLSNRDRFKGDTYNDLPVPINVDAYNKLIKGGVDHMLARHIAHLYIRDPLVIYSDLIEQDNDESTDHFENIQSTNWNTVRFKPPPPGTGIGWRTEFRSMEVGLTDFENAAFSVFMVILSRVILAFKLNFYVPMSKVDENMETAHMRDAVNTQSFYFRKNIFKACDGSGFMCDCGRIHKASLVGGHNDVELDKLCHRSDCDSSSDSDCDPFEVMTLDEIFNGKARIQSGQGEAFTFTGLIPLMRGYLDALEIDALTRSRLLLYLDFVSERASGELITNATYMRNFIQEHPSYNHDSVVSPKITFDLMKNLKDISHNEVMVPELLGRFQAESIVGEVETPDTMMARMQRKMEGAEATPLYGSSIPRMAVHKTLDSIVKSKRNIAQYGY